MDSPERQWDSNCSSHSWISTQTNIELGMLRNGDSNGGKKNTENKIPEC